MLKSRKAKWTVGIAGLLVIGAAVALHYGTYYCGTCTLDGATPDPDTVTFITTDVNQDVEQWQVGDTVTICNAGTCATYKMVSVFGGITGMQQIDKYTYTSGGGSGGPGTYYGGGGTGPEGCVYGCWTGEVTVGEPERTDS